jgi:hypothetical protein
MLLSNFPGIHLGRNHEGLVEIHALGGTSALGVAAGAGVIHQNAAHEPRADGEEMSAILPLYFLDIDEPQVSFVDECRGLQSMSEAFAGEAALGYLAQLRIDQCENPF